MYLLDGFERIVSDGMKRAERSAVLHVTALQKAWPAMIELNLSKLDVRDQLLVFIAKLNFSFLGVTVALEISLS